MISRLEFSTRSHGDQHADGLLDRFGSRRFDSHGAQRLAAASIVSYSCRDELSSLATQPMCRRVYEAIGAGEVQTLVFWSTSIEVTYLL